MTFQFPGDLSRERGEANNSWKQQAWPLETPMSVKHPRNPQRGQGIPLENPSGESLWRIPQQPVANGHVTNDEIPSFSENANISKINQVHRVPRIERKGIVKTLSWNTSRHFLEPTQSLAGHKLIINIQIDRKSGSATAAA